MKNYRIAGIDVGLEPKYEPYLSQVKPYEYPNDGKSVIDITVTDEELKSFLEEYPNLSIGDIEYLITGSAFYTVLIKYSGMMLHSSAVMLDNNAYLFSAPSGTGKSTHTSLWLKEFSGAKILNDDKPAIKIENGVPYVYGTPWSGKSDLNLNTKCPLKGICFISRGKENEIERIEPIKAVPLIYEQTVRPQSRKIVAKLLEVIEEIITKTPIYTMRCNMDPSAARLSHDVMSKGEIK